MSVLDSIIQYKELESAKARADIGMIGNAFQAYQEGRKNTLLLDMEKKKLDAELGVKGLRFSDEGQIVPATDLIDTLGISKKWEPSTKEEAFEFEALKKEPKEWKPKTKEEAFEFERAKGESYTEQKRTDIQSSVEKIRGGQSNFQAERKNLLSKYPDISWDTLQNLGDIEKMYKPDIIKKQREQGIADRQSRNIAIQELKKAGYPVTEGNIKSAMEQLRG